MNGTTKTLEIRLVIFMSLVFYVDLNLWLFLLARLQTSDSPSIFTEILHFSTITSLVNVVFAGIRLTLYLFAIQGTSPAKRSTQLLMIRTCKFVISVVIFYVL